MVQNLHKRLLAVSPELHIKGACALLAALVLFGWRIKDKQGRTCDPGPGWGAGRRHVPHCQAPLGSRLQSCLLHQLGLRVKRRV